MISNKLVRTLTLASLLAAFAITPTFTASAAEKKAEKKEEKGKGGSYPYAGKISAVDKAAKTVTIKKTEASRTYEITAETKISKAGKPATLDDAVVGEEAAAYGHDEGGKHIAQSLRLGPKPDAKGDSSGTPKKKGADKK